MKLVRRSQGDHTVFEMRAATAGFLLLALACGGSADAPTGYTLPKTPRASAVCATLTPLYRAMPDDTSVPAGLDIFAHIVPGGYARYDFTRLNAWDKLLTSALAKATGVRTRQFDLAHNQNLVFVVDASAASAVRGAVRSAGIPDDAVATIIAAR